MVRDRVIGVLIAVAVVGAPSLASAQRVPVDVSARGLFGDELLINDAYGTVLVEVRNRTRGTLRGRVAVTSRHYARGPEKHEIQLDLPPQATRQVTMDLFLADGTTVEIGYVVDDRPVASTAISPAYSASSTGIVVMSDPPRLRGALLELDVEQQTAPQPYAPPSATMVRMPVGVVPLDAQTGDPMLPTSSLAWAPAGILIASAPLLARTPLAEQQALRDWVIAGGTVLIFPRTENDLRDPFVESLAGRLERYEATPSLDQDIFVPEGARGAYYRSDDPAFRVEPYGGSRRLGFGRVHVATYDGTAPPFADAAQTRELVRAILSVRRQHGISTPVLPWGRRVDDVGGGMFYGGGPSFGALRAALDPNEGYRPALGLVAVVLLLYVLVIGPVNFAFVGKRNRPALALVTTPVAACACLVLMLGVGYLGKGTRMRYRAVELVDVQETDAVGPARRYSGLFLTRPAEFDLPSPDRGRTHIIRTGASDVAVTDHAGEQPVVRGLRGRLWETVFVREERIADLGGGITFDRAGHRLVGVRNGTDRTLRGAVVIDGAGSVYRVGTLEPGASAPVSSVAELTLTTTNWYWGQDDPSVAALARIMGMESEQREALDGALQLVGTNLAAPDVPVLLAWSEVADRGEVADTFARELDVQLLRVVPRVDPPSIRMAVPVEPDYPEPIQDPPMLPPEVFE